MIRHRDCYVKNGSLDIVIAMFFSVVLASSLMSETGLLSRHGGIACCLGSLFMLLYFLSLRIYSVFVRVTDCCFLLLWAYAGLRTEGQNFYSYTTAQWISCLIIYLCCRNMSSNKTTILYVISFLGTVEALAGLFQYLFLPDADFLVSVARGSFRNPGPYGCFLCLTLVCTAGLVSLKPKRVIKAGLWLSSGIQLASILLSDSRTAWLALVVAAIYYAGGRIQKKSRMFYFFFSLSGICLFLVCLYPYKSQSADARLFIWQTGIRMFRQSPLVGTGTHSFATRYMDYQAVELSESEDEYLKRQAANNTYAFNEFIHLSVEWGVVGLLLFAGCVFSVYRHRARDGIDRIFCSVFTAYMVICCFSYPLEVWPLSLCFPVLLGCLPGTVLTKCPYPVSFRKWKMLSGTLLCVCLLYPYNHYVLHRRIVFRIDTLYHTGDPHAASELAFLYPRFMNEKEHLLAYGKVLHLQGDTTCVAVLRQCVMLNPTSETLCALGESYQRCGRYRQAEQCFLRAAAMVPGYITPPYLLFRLYRACGEEEKARTKARYILSMRPKVVNSLVLDIKRELKEYMNNH